MATSANPKTPIDQNVIVQSGSDSPPDATQPEKEKALVIHSRRGKDEPRKDKHQSRRENDEPFERHYKNRRTRLEELARLRKRKIQELKELDFQLACLEGSESSGGEHHRRRRSLEKERPMFDKIGWRGEGSSPPKQQRIRVHEQLGPEGRRHRSRTPERKRPHTRDRYERDEPHREEDYYRVATEKPREKEIMGNTRVAAWLALEQLAGNPLSVKLQDAVLPSKIKHGQFTLYETSTDPVRHIQHYQQAMFIHMRDDATMCKMFPSSLGAVALAWFHKLKNESIRNWEQLAEQFIARFIMSRKAPKTFEVLTTIKQGAKEPLRDYAKRFWETFDEIAQCSDEFAIAAFKIGLPMRGKLRQSLTMNPVGTVDQMMERIEQHAA